MIKREERCFSCPEGSYYPIYTVECPACNGKLRQVWSAPKYFSGWVNLARAIRDANEAREKAHLDPI